MENPSAMNARRLFLGMLLLLSCLAAAPSPAAGPRTRHEFLEQLRRSFSSAEGAVPSIGLGAPPAIDPLAPAAIEWAALTCDDGQWSNLFAVAGLDGTPECAVFFEGDLVVGGHFRHADGRRVNHIARWDGQQWHPFGEGFSVPVRALAIWKGRLVAAVPFYGGTVVTLGVWSGAQWEPFAGGITGDVTAMATNDSDLVIARQFWNGTIILSEVSRWDGSAWHAMGENIDGHVLAIARYAGDWVVGGHFTNTSAGPVANIARWDGATWQPLVGGISQAQGSALVLAMATFAGELIVGGQFDSAGPIATTGIARWNGARWDSLPGAPPMLTAALTSDGDLLHIGHWSVGDSPPGNPFLATWNGIAYERAVTGPTGMPEAIAVDGDRLAIAGWFEAVGDRPMRMVALREQGIWRPAASWRAPMRGLSGPVQDFAIYDGSLVAVGQFRFAADDTGWIDVYGAARWDGSRWRVMGRELGPASAGDLVVHQGELFHAAWAVHRWNGDKWEPVGNPPPFGIMRLASFDGHLWGGAQCYGGCVGGLRRYDPPNWVPLPPPAGVPADSSFVTALTVHGGRLVVAWAWGYDFWRPRTRLAAWDGNKWEVLPGLFEGGQVQALASFRGRLCSSGGYLTIDGQPLHGFSILESTGWDSHGWEGGRVDVMESTDSLLIVSGSRLAFFDDVSWCYSFDVNGQAVALLADGGSLWLGGYFDAVRDVGQSFHIARWEALPAPLPRPSVSKLLAGPNPFRDAVSLSFRLERETRVRLSILDLMGREVALLLDARQAVGDHSIPWRGQNDDGRALPAGLYFVRLEIQGVPAAVRRLVRVQ
jgi:hypothetical protein